MNLSKKFAVETNEEPSIEKKAPQKKRKREKTQTFSMMMELKRKTDTKEIFTPPEQNTDDDIYKATASSCKRKLEAREKSGGSGRQRTFAELLRSTKFLERSQKNWLSP